MKRILILVIVLLLAFNSNAQDNIDYKAIDSIGKAFTNRLQQGDIEYLKNSKAPKSTWEYSRLLDFKKVLNKNDIRLYIGSYIGPSKDSSLFAFNLFAYRQVDAKTFDYFFAAIVSIDISDSEYKIKNTYLFTKGEPLKNWWMHAFGFYHESNELERKKIPKEFVYKICPPPPFSVE